MLPPCHGDLQLGGISGHTVRALDASDAIDFEGRLRYTRALMDQPRYALLPPPYASLVPVLLFSIGQILVISSTWALGITGTFLGDYFGILMDAKIEGFPFNIVENPMYFGSTLCFAAGALWYVLGRFIHGELYMLLS